MVKILNVLNSGDSIHSNLNTEEIGFRPLNVSAYIFFFIYQLGMPSEKKKTNSDICQTGICQAGAESVCQNKQNEVETII